ncbi:MAG: ABC transporter permease [Candidatus Nanohaloarchaea archaeon]
MSKYLELAKIGFRESTAYRLDAVMSFATSGFFLLLAYYIWSAIAASGSLATDFSSIITYIFVGQIVSNSVSVNAENQIGRRVREGTIVNELKRPISLRSQVYFNLLGQSVFDLLAKGLPVAALGVLVVHLQFPSLVNGIGFLVSLFLSFNLIFAFSYFTSMFIFWTKVGWSIRSMRSTVQQLLSGVMFPLYLLPAALKPVFYATPFPSMVDGPIQIFQMNVTGNEMLSIFGQQVFWIVIMLVLGELVWLKAKKRMTVQGG